MPLYCRATICFICHIIPLKEWRDEYKKFASGDTSTKLMWCWKCKQIMHRHHFENLPFLFDDIQKNQIRCPQCKYNPIATKYVTKYWLDETPLPSKLMYVNTTFIIYIFLYILYTHIIDTDNYN